MDANNFVVTVELRPTDADRLLWLIQKTAATGRIYDQYWTDLAHHLHQSIEDDRPQPAPELAR